MSTDGPGFVPSAGRGGLPCSPPGRRIILRLFFPPAPRAGWYLLLPHLALMHP